MGRQRRPPDARIAGMPKFLIEVPHPPDKLGCAKAIQVFLQSSSHYLTNAEWGCSDGEHFGWVILEAESKEEACNVVPFAYRADARVIALTRFSLDQVEAVIAQHPD